MCRICRQYRCPPGCPGFMEENKGVEREIAGCACCGASVFAWDRRLTKNGNCYCAECAVRLFPDLFS